MCICINNLEGFTIDLQGSRGHFTTKHVLNIVAFRKYSTNLEEKDFV